MDECLDFSYGQCQAGYFEGGKYPTKPGVYRYVPYRSIGHLNMHTALKSTGRVRCTFLDGERTFQFFVRACPDYGVLEIDEVSGI